MRIKLQLKRVCSCIKNNKEPIKNKNAIHIFNPGKNAQADTGEKFHRKLFPVKALQQEKISIHQVIYTK